MTEQPTPDAQPIFTADFEIIVTGIRTATVGNLTNVVKQVEWIMRGTEQGQVFELPQKTELGDPDADNFVALESIMDPAVIVSWIEAADPRIPAIKSHIQFVLNKQVAEATLASTPLPWAPLPDTTTAAPTT